MIGKPSVTLHDEVVGRLRDMIVEGELTPGARVPERQLCTSFGISRTPLREALKVLASEGLIVLLPNRGARVARLTAKDVEDMFQVMGALEALSGEVACARIDDAGIAEIRALHYQMLAHYARRQLPDYFRLNQRIHESIVAAADNAVLTAQYQALSSRIRRARYLANMSRQRWDEAMEEHEAILDALVRRDGARLAAVLKQHLRHKGEEVIRAGFAEPEPAAAEPGTPPGREGDRAALSGAT